MNTRVVFTTLITQNTYDIGAEAYHQLKHYSENPYAKNDWRHNEWWLGWDSFRESDPDTWDDAADDFSAEFKASKPR